MIIYKVSINCMRIQYILNVKNIDRYNIKDSNISFKYLVRSIRKYLFFLNRIKFRASDNSF
jgi:hypothetical protein